mmetsp:Transcript_67920/g.191446  ORF Transcript_67920/g.191446 Transcript_67920/m.191446 type:complete len:446 (-) Transcript_67920:262-1599(-)
MFQEPNQAERDVVPTRCGFSDCATYGLLRGHVGRQLAVQFRHQLMGLEDFEHSVAPHDNEVVLAAQLNDPDVGTRANSLLIGWQAMLLLVIEVAEGAAQVEPAVDAPIHALPPRCDDPLVLHLVSRLVVCRQVLCLAVAAEHRPAVAAVGADQPQPARFAEDERDNGGGADAIEVRAVLRGGSKIALRASEGPPERRLRIVASAELRVDVLREEPRNQISHLVAAVAIEDAEEGGVLALGEAQARAGPVLHVVPLALERHVVELEGGIAAALHHGQRRRALRTVRPPRRVRGLEPSLQGGVQGAHHGGMPEHDHEGGVRGQRRVLRQRFPCLAACLAAGGLLVAPQLIRVEDLLLPELLGIIGPEQCAIGQLPLPQGNRVAARGQRKSAVRAGRSDDVHPDFSRRVLRRAGRCGDAHRGISRYLRRLLVGADIQLGDPLRKRVAV